MNSSIDFFGLLADAVAERVLARMKSEREEKASQPEVLSPAAVARRWKIRTATVFAALKAEELPAKRQHGRGGKLGWLIRPADAEKWASSRG